MSLKKCVVSFADSTGSYQKKMLRLEESLKGNFDGDFLGFTSYKEIGCEPHSVIPYKFKPYAIQKAIDLGYELILWCDSPIYAKQSIQPVFDHIEDRGYLFFDNIGYSLGDYTNDKTLQHFNITREQSWKIKMIMACCMGFSMGNLLFSHGKDYTSGVPVRSIFDEYKNVANNLYPGEWDNDDLTESKDRRVKGHRHDQSVMSALIEINGVNILKGQDTFFAYETHRQVMPIADSVCLYSG
jgi:hypothetical protein